MILKQHRGKVERPGNRVARGKLYQQDLGTQGEAGEALRSV